MQTRQVTQVLVYYLVMNPMTGRAEDERIAACSYDKDKLIAWYESQKHEGGWQDGQWGKTFKKDSPLEWFNGLMSFEIDHWNHGLYEQWVNLEGFRQQGFFVE